MSKRQQFEMPATLREAQERFTQWRGSHAGRKAIPAALWKLASDLAADHEVFRTAQALRLDYVKLKRQTQAVSPAAIARSKPAAGFIELVAPLTCECVIEVEGPRGRSTAPR